MPLLTALLTAALASAEGPAYCGKAGSGVDALRAGGEMDATSTSRTSGNAVRAALELFDALRGGAHIVHDER